MYDQSYFFIRIMSVYQRNCHGIPSIVMTKREREVIRLFCFKWSLCRVIKFQVINATIKRSCIINKSSNKMKWYSWHYNYVVRTKRVWRHAWGIIVIVNLCSIVVFTAALLAYIVVHAIHVLGSLLCVNGDYALQISLVMASLSWGIQREGV